MNIPSNKSECSFRGKGSGEFYSSSLRLQKHRTSGFTRRRIASRQKPKNARPFNWQSDGIRFGSDGRIVSQFTTRTTRPSSEWSKTVGTKPKSNVTDAATRMARANPSLRTPRPGPPSAALAEEEASFLPSRMRWTSRSAKSSGRRTSTLLRITSAIFFSSSVIAHPHSEIPTTHPATRPWRCEAAT